MAQRTLYLHPVGFNILTRPNAKGKYILVLLIYLVLARLTYLFVRHLLFSVFIANLRFLVSSNPFSLWCLHHVGHPCRHAEAPQCPFHLPRKKDGKLLGFVETGLLPGS